MDEDIETSLVSIVKAEDIEIKEEPIEDDGQYNREEKFGVLGNFYQVECNAGPTECMEEGEEEEEVEEEEVVQRNVKGYPSNATTPLSFVILSENPRPNALPEQTPENTERSDVTPSDSNLPPLVKAAEVGDLSELELLLKNDPSPKQVGEALLRAGSPSVVKMIYQTHPEIIRGPEGSRALYFAAEWGRMSLLCGLLDAGLDPNTASRSTLTVLHKAAAKGHVDCVHALLERGADISVTNNTKWSALHLAAMNGTTDCMSILVKAGADIEAQDKTGCTPLHYAARWNHVDAVKWLLMKGASQSAKNHRGKTPLDLTNGGEILKLLTKDSRAENLEDRLQLKVKRLKK
ncbi:Poly [ADP-ribose] polymerase tankyrase [Gryllus bimaculatus]|nr:Poly [ADP-ribose] polymerase tankyrase [Gryllus bimaculatus]